MIATCLKIYTKAGKVNSHDDQCSSVIIEVKKMNNVQSVHCSCHCSEENLVFSDSETHSLALTPFFSGCNSARSTARRNAQRLTQLSCMYAALFLA